ncbi:MAG: ParB N-terminal domain-containing protein [Anaerolineae bacterium]|nr:ParB N-terminal domain-containing protein [Anaerolineae bacterium]
MSASAPAMPDLRIVPTTNVIPHEEHDFQRAEPLIARIREAGSWLNPPIVAPLDQDRYVILDGANRHYSITRLNYPYILVQVVNYESDEVQLRTWHHVVSGISWFEFLRGIRQINSIKLESVDLLHARASLARREALAYTVLTDKRAYVMRSLDNGTAARTDTLRELVDTYKRNGTLNRINTDVISDAREMYPQAVAIVVFPHFEPAEILVAARDGLRLPPGISRHIIHGRAMRLHYPLTEFQENGESLEEKNHKLKLWVQERLAQRRVRYYAESSYLFDE